MNFQANNNFVLISNTNISLILLFSDPKSVSLPHPPHLLDILLLPPHSPVPWDYNVNTSNQSRDLLI